jgi:hypothetical protein
VNFVHRVDCVWAAQRALVEVGEPAPSRVTLALRDFARATVDSLAPRRRRIATDERVVFVGRTDDMSTYAGKKVFWRPVELIIVIP